MLACTLVINGLTCTERRNDCTTSVALCNSCFHRETQKYQEYYLGEKQMNGDSNEHNFITKDSGERESFSTGMVRDTQKGKARFDLVYKPLLWRWAELMARGAEKYGPRNWEKASIEEELERFKASAERHLQQALRGDTDEDHFAAVCFNLGGILFVQERLASKRHLKND